MLIPGRHGWGCTADPERAITYLSTAASNSAQVESLALSAGKKKGGAAKGELVLAMFELAQCYRQGWGVKKDLVAAKTYYETAANLGDTDAMNEVAACYLEGIGCKKDKVSERFLHRWCLELPNTVICIEVCFGKIKCHILRLLAAVAHETRKGSTSLAFRAPMPS